jgi:hypothetical protein
MHRKHKIFTASLVLLLGACRTQTASPPSQIGSPAHTATQAIISTPVTTRTAAAPDERLLDFDIPVEMVFVPNQPPDALTFYADRARRVAVELYSTDGDVNLSLQARILDEAGSIVPKISAPLGEPILRDEWDLPGPGPYSIQLFGPEEYSRAFTLTLTSRPIPEIGGGTITYGETHSGEIAIRGQRDSWTFYGSAGDHVLVTLQAVGSDAYLELYDPAGQLIARNDDATGTHNAILQMTVMTDGEYRIIVRMYDDNQTGTYQLALENTP